MPDGAYRQKTICSAREEAGSNGDGVVRAMTFEFCSRFILREKDGSLWWDQRRRSKVSRLALGFKPAVVWVVVVKIELGFGGNEEGFEQEEVCPTMRGGARSL